MSEISMNNAPEGKPSAGWIERLRPYLPHLVLFIGYFTLRWYLLGGMPAVVYSDTAGYINQYRGGFGEGLFGRPRPWGYPFFLWLTGYRWGLAAALQRIAATLAWYSIALAAGNLFRTAIARRLVIGGILIISLTLFVIQWDVMLLSESLSISAFIAIAAVWAVFLPSERPGLTWLAALLILAVLLAGLRDSGAPLLIFFAVISVAELARKFYATSGTHRAYGVFLGGLVIAGLLVAWAFLYNVESQRGHRSWSNIGNVLARRAFIYHIEGAFLLVNPEAIKWLGEQYQLPEAEARERAGHLVTEAPLPSPQFREWLETKGTRAWIGFMLHYPGWAFSRYPQIHVYAAEHAGYDEVEPEKWKQAHLGLSRAIHAGLYRGLGWFFGFPWLHIAVLPAAVLLGVLWIAAWFRRGLREYCAALGFLFWLISISALSALISYIGDDIEGWRHALLGLMSLYLALPLGLGLLAEAGLNKLNFKEVKSGTVARGAEQPARKNKVNDAHSRKRGSAR